MKLRHQFITAILAFTPAGEPAITFYDISQTALKYTVRPVPLP